MLKVLVSDKIADEGIELLEKEFQVDIKTGLDENELLDVIQDYDALIVRSSTQVTGKVIRKSNLKVIGRAGVGVDNIDIDCATKKGILVVNAPEGNTVAASEHTIALLTSIARNIPQAAQSLKEKRWERSEFMGSELTGKTLGIIGYGRIGKLVAKKAIGLDMNILAYDPYIIKEHVENPNVEITDLEEILKNSDFITFHIPLTEKSYHMIGEEQIAKMKDGVRIINCARGGIIDESALYDALKSGKVAACALDVFEHEPPLESPLIGLPNVIATPHLGASTKEAQKNVAKDVAKDVIRALKGEIVKNPVNIVSVRPEDFYKIKPYIKLSEKLGLLYTQLKNGRIKEIELTFQGRIEKFDVNPITTSCIKGILSNILQYPANSVNAPIIARERGIKIIQKKISKDQDAPGVITMKVTSDKEISTIAGTIANEDEPRVISIDGYKIDLLPEGNVLITFHSDRPGIVGKVGTILGKNNINIAYMQLGRKALRGEALMAIGVDEDIDNDVLNHIRKIEDMNNAVVIRF